MQRIIYENPAGESVTITPNASPYIFESVTGVSAIDTQLIIHHPAGLDGALYRTLVLNDREVTVNLHVFGEDRQALYRNRLELIQLCASAGNKDERTGKLWYINSAGAWWIPATVKQGPKERGERKKNYLPMQIVFYCPNPLWRAEDATIDKLAYIAGGFKFPLCIPAITEPKPGIKFGSRGYRAEIVNDGDSPAPVELEISGPATVPKIEHKRTGQYIAVNQELEVGDKLYINTEPGRKEVKITKATGEESNAMGLIDLNSTFFLLEPGNNLLEYTSGNDTTLATVVVRTWSRYGGV